MNVSDQLREKLNVCLTNHADVLVGIKSPHGHEHLSPCVHDDVEECTLFDNFHPQILSQHNTTRLIWNRRTRIDRVQDLTISRARGALLDLLVIETQQRVQPVQNL